MEIRKVMAGGLAALTAGATLAFGVFAGLGDYVDNTTPPTVVVGDAVDSTDTIAAADLAAGVAGFVTTSVSTGTGASVGVSNGADVSTADNKLYVGSVMNKAKNTLTSVDMPSLLAKGTVTASGVAHDYDQYITLGSHPLVRYGTVAAANVLDPVVNLRTSSGSTGANTNPTYNLTVVFNKELNLSSSKVQGKQITLFGTDYTIGSGSGATTAGVNPLILFGSGTTEQLILGTPVNVVIEGVTYEVEASFIGSNQLLLKVNGVTSDTLVQGDTDQVGGLDVFVKSILYSAVQGVDSLAIVSLGSSKLTLTHGSAVTVGTSTTLDGTLVDLVGTTSSGVSRITVSVAASDSTEAYIGDGDSFTDPVFGSFKLAFNGLTPDLTASSRDVVTAAAGTTQVTTTFTDSKLNTKTQSFAIDNAGTIALNATTTQAINVVEGVTINQNDFFVFAPSQESEFGHIFRLSSMSGISGSSPKFTLEDVITGSSTTYELGNNGQKTFFVDGQQIIAMNESSAQMNFTWGGSASTAFPLIKLKNGEFMTFITNTTVLTQGTTYELPGNTSVTLTAELGVDGWELVSAGRISYYFINDTATNMKLVNISSSAGTLLADEFPAILIQQEQDNTTNKDFVLIETYARDTTNNYIGLRAPTFSDGTVMSASWSSNNQMTSAVDIFGSYITRLSPSGSGETVTVYYPDTQAIATIGVGSNPTFSVGSAGSVEQALPITSPIAKFASEITSPSSLSNDVILVGGPCANALVATLAETEASIPSCDEWNLAEGLIKNIDNAFGSGKKALVVAGTLAADTRNMASKALQGTMDYSV
jgi:hypothetical protein